MPASGAPEHTPPRPAPQTPNVAGRLRATLIGANLTEYPDHVLLWNSTELTRNRTRNVRCDTADQDRYDRCANGEPQELH